MRSAAANDPIAAMVIEPERIILFGSHARGDARPESDVDLLVLFAEVESPDLEAARRIMADDEQCPYDT